MSHMDITKYSDIITSDELKEFIEYWEIEEDLTNEEKELFDEAKRLLNEYGDDADYWWSQHERMYKEVTSYPKEIYEGQHEYEILMAGERIHRYITQMG